MKKSISAFLLVLVLIISGMTPAFAAIRGDIDTIPGITASDARLVLRASVGLETLTEEQILAADVDGTEGISAADARLILRAAVGLEDLGEIEGVHVHSYTTKKITKEPTCTEPGIQKFICVCGKEITEDLKPLGHDYQLTTEEAPTCKKQGKNVFTCSHCLNTKTEFIPRLEHDYQIAEEKTAACEAAGHIKYQCKNCTSVRVENLPATGHSYNADTGLCASCGNSDPEHYDIIPLREKWVIEDNWEISIESVVNHPLHAPEINQAFGYTEDQQSVLIRYNVKSLGYTSNIGNNQGLTITPLDFVIYDEAGTQSSAYACNHTDYAHVIISGAEDSGIIPVVLQNNSKTITIEISEYDSDGVLRKARFTAKVMD